MKSGRCAGNDGLLARLAKPEDRPLVSALLASAARRHGMLAVEEQVASLASGVSSLAIWQGEPAGFLGLTVRQPDRDPVEQWIDVTIASAADRVDAGPVFRRLVDAVRAVLSPNDITGICALAAEDWFSRALADAGFAEVDRVISYLRDDLRTPPSLASPARLWPLLPADANAVLALNAASFAPLWRYDATRILSWVLTADHAVIAEERGHFVGFALTTSQTLVEYAQLIRLAIHPEMQGLGIGRQLVVDAIAYARRIGSKGLMLNTQASNAASRHIYGALGFEGLEPSLPVMVLRP